MIIADPDQAKQNAYSRAIEGTKVALYSKGSSDMVILHCGSVHEGPFSRRFRDQCGFAENADIVLRVTIQEATEQGIRDLSGMKKFLKMEYDNRQFTITAIGRRTKVLDTFLWYEIGGKVV